jgi:hypothetical protein
MTQEAKDDNRKRHEERKLIGLFMGYKVREFAYPDKSLGISFYDEGGTFYEKRWDKCWDDLMPVVEKIESLEIKLSDEYEVFDRVNARYDVGAKAYFGVYIFRRCCDVQIENSTEDHIVEVTAAKSKIEAIYTAVIKFIKWYNQQKQ